MDFAAPGCLGQKSDFNTTIAVPIMRGQKSNADDAQKAVVRGMHS